MKTSFFICSRLSQHHISSKIWHAVAAESMVFVSTSEFFVSTFQFFMTRFKKKLSTHLKQKCVDSFLCVCSSSKSCVDSFFVSIIVIFYVIFNILRKRVKDHTCLYYAIIILCNYYIVVS